jgi:hypothetical protein
MPQEKLGRYDAGHSIPRSTRRLNPAKRPSGE